jgi:hypothetical protein
MRRVIDGGSEAFFWIATGMLRAELFPQRPELTLSFFGLFLAFYTLCVFGFFFFISLPLRALNTQGLLIIRLWRTYARDTRLFVYVIATVAWGYVATLIWIRAGITLGLVSFAPLPFLASALR